MRTERAELKVQAGAHAQQAFLIKLGLCAAGPARRDVVAGLRVVAGLWPLPGPPEGGVMDNRQRAFFLILVEKVVLSTATRVSVCHLHDHVAESPLQGASSDQTDLPHAWRGWHGIRSTALYKDLKQVLPSRNSHAVS